MEQAAISAYIQENTQTRTRTAPRHLRSKPNSKIHLWLQFETFQVKTTNVQRRKKKVPKFTLVCFLANDAKKNKSAFFYLFFFSGTKQPVETQREMMYKTFKDTITASVITHRHMEHVHSYIQCGFHWSLPMTRAHTHFDWRVHGY